jgi:hypothetical protein
MFDQHAPVREFPQIQDLGRIVVFHEAALERAVESGGFMSPASRTLSFEAVE